MSVDTDIAVVMEPSPRPGPRLAPPAPPHERWGEELPVFCEQCGYSFNGLTQIRCRMCDVLHFSCPECGHHQPINTLRPAFQRVLGRLRALGLALIVFIKMNFFFWVLFAWAGFGTELASHEIYRGFRGNRAFSPRGYQPEIGFLIFIFATAFAAIGRMLLLRWRRGVIIGLTVGGLVVLALIIGVYLQRSWYNEPMPTPFTNAFKKYLLCAVIGGGVGGAAVWGVWMALAHAFLPKRTATSLIEWQRTMSASDPSPTRADAAMSVTS
jgi:hypothetical protein